MAIIEAPLVPTHDLGLIQFTSLATPSRGSSDTAVWRVEIAPGAPVTPHSLTREEVFVVLAGCATVSIGGVVGDAPTGSAIIVPANTPFAVSNTASEPLHMLCCLPVGGQAVVDGATFTPPWAE
jgi:mannose-6-phosphate isomerase-like protein (cupin superfamily)